MSQQTMERVATASAVEEPLASSDRGEGPYLQRFTPLERVTHALMLTSFFGLVLTGLPLHFSYTGWASTLMGILGGVRSAGLIHRFCGLVTFGYFFLHLG
ncbi:MAG TPA: hypothetical protein VFV33_08675, partial [Gemmatimonadaceae bacterium]|nr:hypothetical protein [Gemmatimonadaceae bacterium]